LIGSTASLESADQFNGHVGLACDLTAQPDTGIGDFANTECFFFGLGDLVRFAIDEFHSAGGATGMTTAGMKLVGSSIFGKGFDEPGSVRNLKLADTLDVQFGHTMVSTYGFEWIIRASGRTTAMK
jgi:hypothetical protein